MEQQELFAYESKCFQEDMPHCQAACPLQVDVRSFMQKAGSGDFGSARKVLERHLPLPGLLGRICDHPCENVCLRKDLGGSLAVGSLEKYCVSLLPTQTKALPIPRKSKKMAIFGDGLAALTVAWDLARKGYELELYHEEDIPGLGLSRQFGLEPDILEAELDVIRKGRIVFHRQPLNHALFDKTLADVDALFVDASSAPNLAKSRAEVDPLSLTSGDGKISYGGWPDNYSPVTWAAEGRKAASSMERVAGGISLTASREKEGVSATRLQTPLDGVFPLNRLPEDSAQGFADAELATTEAARCLQCECMACVHQCAYMQHYQGYPKTFARQIYNNASIVKGQHLANSLINGCALCGQCAEICPENFSMADLCLSSRREMVRRGYMPPSAHEFALEDMDTANSEQCSVFFADGALDGQCANLFFPGCQLGASRPEQVAEVFRHLTTGLAGKTGLGLACCGVPAKWSGRDDLSNSLQQDFRQKWLNMGKPRVIAACSTCLQTLREAHPDMPVVSLWQVLLEECPEPESSSSLTLSIQDPCTARNNAEWLQAVRKLAIRHGVEIIEPRLSADKTACCGYGGLVWSAQPQVADGMTRHRAAQLDHPALASCVMCRDRLAGQGKDCLHLLDVLFPDSSAYAANQPGPGLSLRRMNRVRLKTAILREYLGVTMEDASGKLPVLYLEPDVQARLEARHILLQDLAQVLKESLDGQKSFKNPTTGRYLTSWRPRRVTFWVEFAEEDGDMGKGYRIFDAYSHRMVVPQTGNVGEDAGKTELGMDSSFRPEAERSR